MIKRKFSWNFYLIYTTKILRESERDVQGNQQIYYIYHIGILQASTLELFIVFMFNVFQYVYVTKTLLMLCEPRKRFKSDFQLISDENLKVEYWLYNIYSRRCIGFMEF